MTLQQRIYQNNVTKGFYENPASRQTRIALINSEIFEALEAYRKNNLNPDFSDEQSVKDYFECEIADAYIRVLDFMEHEKFEREDNFGECMWTDDIGDNLMGLSFGCCYIWNHDKYDAKSLSDLLYIIESFSDHYKFDLMKFVEWKVEYNTKRPYKHGKQF